jgi:hypothetical protein
VHVAWQNFLRRKQSTRYRPDWVPRHSVASPRYSVTAAGISHRMFCSPADTGPKFQPPSSSYLRLVSVSYRDGVCPRLHNDLSLVRKFRGTRRPPLIGSVVCAFLNQYTTVTHYSDKSGMREGARTYSSAAASSYFRLWVPLWGLKLTWRSNSYLTDKTVPREAKNE